MRPRSLFCILLAWLLVGMHAAVLRGQDAAAPADVKAAPAPAIEELLPAVAAPAAPEKKVEEPVVPAAAPAAPVVEAPKAGDAPVAAPAAPAIEELLPGVAPAPVKKVEPATPAAPATEAPAVAAPVEGTTPAAVKLGSPERVDQGKLLADQEIVRRKEKELAGRIAIEQADKAFKDGDYAAAATHYRAALTKLPAVPEQAVNRQRATDRLPECEYEVVLGLMKANKNQEALVKAKDAAARYPDNKKFKKVIVKLEDMLIVETPPTPGPTGKPVTEAQKQMLLGKRQMAARDYEHARTSFESVLAIESGNREAMRYLKELGDRRYVNSSVERDATRAKMTAQVRDTWNPHYKMVKSVTVTKTNEAPTGNNILGKMEKIIIDEIEFRQANIHDVVQFLNKASVEGDKQESDPTKKGVNIILNLNPSGTGAPAAPAAPAGSGDLFGPADGGAGKPGGQQYEITFQARYISLLSALKIITSVAGLRYRVDGNIVMIVPSDYDPAQVEVRMYPVEPTFFERVKETAAAMPVQGARGAGTFTGMPAEEPGAGSAPDVKTYFENMGVKFPKGSSIVYNSAIGKVIVANTSENLATFEKILQELNVVPKQVEIEARFVEVNETDLQEMGLEWLLNDNWELATKKTGSFTPLSATPNINVAKNSTAGGFTSGLRFWNMGASGDEAVGGGQGTMGSIAKISSVLTNPELSMILHLLEQNGNADLLSAPKVTTRSGTEASIRVVTEYIYPTTFTVQGGQLNNNANNANNANLVQETVVVPEDFATREVGVILTVLPEVSPDGNMINLTMTPSVVTEPTWQQYGSTIRRADGSVQQLNMPQPFFHVRTLTTQISIYDGATVVMGGLITEDLRKVNDKIPVLGDIPLIGILFRSNSERSVKKNLLIFVTAKLVDPAGRLIRNPDADAGPTAAVPGGLIPTIAKP